MSKPKDFPLDDVIATTRQRVEEGWIIHQKWTCRGCGKRVTANNPNMITEMGHCEECDHVTDLRKHGCNWMGYLGLTPVA